MGALVPGILNIGLLAPTISGQSIIVSSQYPLPPVNLLPETTIQKSYLNRPLLQNT